MYNPSLRRETRYEPAAVLQITRDQTLIDWLESNNRIIFREKEETPVSSEEEDITDLMDGEDNNSFEDDSSSSDQEM